MRHVIDALLADFGLSSGMTEAVVRAYDPDQPRDEIGRWTDGGGGVAQGGFTDAEIAQVREYQNGVGVNILLRQVASGSDFERAIATQRLKDPQYRKQIAELDAAIAKGKATKDLTVYRGQHMLLLKIPKNGETFTDAGYVATSTDRDVARGFGTVMEIRVPKGTSALDVNAMLGDATRYENQREILLPRDLTFRVISDNPDAPILEVVNASNR